jgi:hypothetical protein
LLRAAGGGIVKKLLLLRAQLAVAAGAAVSMSGCSVALVQSQGMLWLGGEMSLVGGTPCSPMLMVADLGSVFVALGAHPRALACLFPCCRPCHGPYTCKPSIASL